MSGKKKVVKKVVKKVDSSPAASGGSGAGPSPLQPEIANFEFDWKNFQIPLLTPPRDENLLKALEARFEVPGLLQTLRSSN